MSQDFNSVVPEAIPIVKEDYNIVPGHQVKWGVLEILPLKTEIEALDAAALSADDVRKMVPWDAGIIMRVIGLKSRDPQNIIRDLISQDPNGIVTLNFGSKYMSQWVKLDRGEVERGWARQYNRDKRKLVYDFPPNWGSLANMQKYAYWMTMMGGRYGFAPGALAVGSTFYAYFTRQKSKQDKWFSDVKKVYKDNEIWYDECPTELGTIPLATLRQTWDIIDAALEQSRQDYADRTNGDGAPVYTNPGGSYTHDPNAGF